MPLDGPPNACGIEPDAGVSATGVVRIDIDRLGARKRSSIGLRLEGAARQKHRGCVDHDR